MLLYLLNVFSSNVSYCAVAVSVAFDVDLIALFSPYLSSKRKEIAAEGDFVFDFDDFVFETQISTLAI